MNTEMRTNRQDRRAAAVLNLIADRVDLAIDLLTLGQYGLERAPEDCKRRSGREPRATTGGRRRGDCVATTAIAWDWPSERAAR